MSMLDRYRKTGGFYQLLSLVETCGAAKQEKFLELIKAEDSRWADAVKAKMLDVTRIYAWSDETLAEIVGTLQDLTLAIALHAATEPLRARLCKSISHGRKRKIDDLFESNKPTPSEIASTHMKIIETVRKMVHDGYLRLDKVDPSLHFDEKFEEELLRPSSTRFATAGGLAPAATSSSMFQIEYESAPPAAPEAPVKAEAADGKGGGAELTTLRSRVESLSKENAVLRHELSIAKNKLDQIKKIA